MSSLSASFFRSLCLLALAVGTMVGVARADLVWGPDTGWRIEGGALSGLTGPEGRNALDVMNQARKYEEDKRLGKALSAYNKVTKKYASSIFAAEAFYRMAKIRLERKQYFKAFDAYQQIVGRFPNTKRFNEIIQDEYQIASILLDGARNHIWGLIPSFTNREKAVEYFETIVADAPYGEYAALALMDAARGRQYLGDKEEAIDSLDRMINNYPESVLAPEAYLRLAQLHASLDDGPAYDQAEGKQSITYDEDFMILYPSDPKISQAAEGLDVQKKVLAESKMTIADFYFFKRSNYTAARVFYNEAITSYPDSDVAKKARVRLTEVEAKAAAAASTGGVKKHHFLFF